MIIPKLVSLPPFCPRYLNDKSTLPHIITPSHTIQIAKIQSLILPPGIHQKLPAPPIDAVKKQLTDEFGEYAFLDAETDLGDRAFNVLNKAGKLPPGSKLIVRVPHVLQTRPHAETVMSLAKLFSTTMVIKPTACNPLLPDRYIVCLGRTWEPALDIPATQPPDQQKIQQLFDYPPPACIMARLAESNVNIGVDQISMYIQLHNIAENRQVSADHHQMPALHEWCALNGVPVSHNRQHGGTNRGNRMFKAQTFSFS